MQNPIHPHIDGLRAVAVLIVIAFHLDLAGFDGGFVGVDVFFVISGFLITRQLISELERTGSVSLRAFYMRRIRRLVPAYLCMLALTTLAAVLVFSPTNLERFGNALRFAVIGLSNLVFWVEADYFDVSASSKPLLHTWSLSVEEQFYLLWPVLLIVAYRFQREGVFWTIAAVGTVSLLLNASAPALLDLFPVTTVSSTGSINLKATLFYLTPFRIFELALGALLASRPSLNTTSSMAHWMGISGLLMIAVAVWRFDEEMLFPAHHALLPCVGAMLIIASGGVGRAGALLRAPLFTAIGRLSYSLYLFHWPVIVFWSYLKVSPLGAIDRTLILALSLGLAGLSYRFIEIPFRRGIPLERSGSRRLTLATAACVLALSGSLLIVSDGWRSRTADQTDAIAVHAEIGYEPIGALRVSERPIDVVLTGDSHARHYAYGLERRVARTLNLNVYLYSGESCLHLPGLMRVGNEKNFRELCPASVDGLIDFVTAQHGTPLVVISQSWISQMKRGVRMSDEQGPLDTEDLITGLRKLKRAIGDNPMLVIGQVPTTNNIDVAEIITRPPMGRRTSFDTLRSLPLSKEVRALNLALADFAAKEEDIGFFDPTVAFCDGDLCATMDELNRSYYADRTHLSRRGSEQAVDELLGTLMPLLPEKHRLLAASTGNSSFSKNSTREPQSEGYLSSPAAESSPRVASEKKNPITRL